MTADQTIQTEEVVIDDLVADAIRHGISATEPTSIGDHGIVRLVPDGYHVHINDRREWSDDVAPSYQHVSATFSDLESFVEFFGRYRTDATIVFGAEPHVSTPTLLHASFDYHADGDGVPGRRDQHASLALTKTEAFARWVNAFDAIMSQDTFLELIVDGIGEIADPPGADLQELVSDLHSMRKTNVQSVVTTSGASKVVLDENVNLHDGNGSEVVMPSAMRLVVTPYTTSLGPIELAVSIRPRINDSGKVTFRLRCPHLLETLREHVREIAGEFSGQTGAPVLWQP